ncbi:MAG: peptidoglycan editing factor PgeF [Gammaproteobacteria bacterium]|nr:peptidoglycan editing factor PgeF [Gammaproteobacteria bacterium]
MTQGVSSPQGSWLTPDWDVAPNVRALSTLRGGGLSMDAYASFNLAQHVGDDPQHVRANRALLRAAAKLPSEPLWLEQVHGSHVVEHAGPAAPGAVPPRADAAVTFEPGRVCVVLTADCLPVVFADRAGTRIGVAHAGWRGLVGGVLEATVAALDVEPAQLVAWLGPGIGPAAFEVGPEVRDAFIARDAASDAAFARNESGRFQADLYGLARRALSRVGVHRVSGGGRCTQREAAEFFSFRRDGGRTGRMATLAWLAPGSDAGWNADRVLT